MAVFNTRQDEEPPKDLPAPDPGKRWKKTTRVEDGHPIEEWTQVVDEQGYQWPERKGLKILNKETKRIDGPLKVSGKAVYSHDVRLPDMLYGRVLTCPYGTARVKLDIAPALKIDGVEVVVPLLNDVLEAESAETRYLGQPVAAVAARTPELADDAIRAIRAEFEQLDFAITYAQSIRPNAPKVRKAGRRGPRENVQEEEKEGDREEVESLLETCDVVTEGTYELPIQHHCCLETHGIVVDYRGGEEATVWASTQGTFTIGGAAAKALDLPSKAVRVRVEHMGGGFGSKFGMGTEGRAACMLAKKAGKPVHLMYQRGDEFVTGGNRSGARQTLRGGASSEGRFLALTADVATLGGTGSGSNAGQPYIYNVEDSYLGQVSVRTHTDSSRAMRAPGHPQASFAIESIVDDLAYGIGMDPVEFRKKNLEDPVFHRQLDAVAREIGWSEHANRLTPGSAESALKAGDENAEKLIGIGFGVAGWWGGGGPGCETDVKVERDGSVSAAIGSQDLGTGVRTYIAGIVAEVLGLEVGDITVNIGDSRLGKANPSGGSTTTGSVAPTVLVAAMRAAAGLRGHVSKALGVDENQVRFEGGKVLAEGAEAIPFERACGLLPPQGLSVRGEWIEDLQGGGVHTAQAAKVEVDVMTGRVRVLKMVAMQDCGLPLNRLALKSQIHGGMIQSLSYALLEERVLEPNLGIALNPNFEDYKIAGTMEMPEFVALIDDDDDRPFPIGMAESAIIPGHSAIGNAIRNACGVRLTSTPFTPDKILDALYGSI